MKKTIQQLLVLSSIGILFLVGCANHSESVQNIDGFILSRILPSESDAENPETYIVAPEESKDKVVLLVPALGENIGTKEEKIYDLENVSVTEEEIVIQFNDTKHRFNRLSESVAENSNGIQYQYDPNSTPENN